MDITESEKAVTKAVKSSSDVREKFRNELVPKAFQIYLSLLSNPDPKIQKSAADSIMKIEGSLQPQAAASGSGVSINLDFTKLQEMGKGLEKMVYADIKEIDKET